MHLVTETPAIVTCETVLLLGGPLLSTGSLDTCFACQLWSPAFSGRHMCIRYITVDTVSDRIVGI